MSFKCMLHTCTSTHWDVEFYYKALVQYKYKIRFVKDLPWTIENKQLGQHEKMHLGQNANKQVKQHGNNQLKKTSNFHNMTTISLDNKQFRPHVT